MDNRLADTDLEIDGARLRYAREQAGWTVIEAAKIVTLSREQIRQIESGEMTAFYSARHKQLAARKYAQTVGIDLSEVLRPSCSGLDASRSPALSADGGGSGDERPNQRKLVDELLKNVSRHSIAGGVIVAGAAIMLVAVMRGVFVTAPSPTLATPEQFVPPTPSSSAASDSLKSTALASPENSSGAMLPDPTCQGNAQSREPASWSPSVPRRSDTRIFLSSVGAVTVCVADSNGMRRELRLQPGEKQSVAGKPPYLLSSPQFEAVQVFMQGRRVRVPPDSAAIRLFAAPMPREPEALEAVEPTTPGMNDNDR